ncbi:Type IV secretion system protein virB4 (part 2) [Candidatus Hamiltonella defensa (Bemisia tabaci)]|uniref:hypothetical protein n=1 Tax=Candidatus Williamhamiltonella defendens TaxID=138072 RepID=UPI00061898A9|nr:hypothetical protein [Candidatus Hamiltonella defensa]CED78960.1 Type IV secretion system protein virB4 (part 2) [Candidatus Hamiltonella defensa (Bemisia tabaci)]
MVDLIPSSREFMVKQGHQAVMVKFVLDEKLKYWLVWVCAFLAEMQQRHQQEKTS